ncbi:MAG: hypothetical protein GWN29_13775 [Gammaproteobacteria bacterium]|nr:hypothetical protein [Gammaproteobacteria bacterium]
MRRALLVAAVVASFLAAPSFAQNWVEYIHLTERFGVMFPGVPEISETTHESAHHVIYPARVYSVDSISGNYSVTVVDYTEAQRRHRERPDQTDASSGPSFWIMDVRASVAHAAQGFRARGGEVTFDAWADIDKVEGHNLQITNPDQSRSFIAIHLNDGRLYILEARVPRGFPPPGLVQQSLFFLDEEGERIRYTFDINGQRVAADQRPFGVAAEGVTRMVVE